MIKKLIILFAFGFLLSTAYAQQSKPVIYQMLVRLFGNRNTTNKFYGSIKENGSGKFNDITGLALDSIKALGVDYIWYTGVLEHAAMTDYSKDGIRIDDPDVVKGRAGSPYAVKDYYDVDPDLAVHVKKRMQEFQALIGRTHKHGLKALMDFIPNHVARGYFSDAKPASVVGFGEQDDTSKAFSPKNDFYYLPGTSFVVPEGVDAGGSDFHSPLKDGKFYEVPAKVTGNNVFKPNPSINDWYETIKLNYGVDVLHEGKTYFKPIPPVWLKMRDILSFWARKGIDGFRCDVAEMVPAEFWHWVIPQIKKINPQLIFIAEAYSPEKYEHYIGYGHFDYLYNKVGMYDILKKIIRNESDANTAEVDSVVNAQQAFSQHMLNFLENHDEERIASGEFAGNPWLAKPAMVAAATISQGPVMIYFGQELGEKAAGAEGFGGDDGKTTIFDYWSVPTIARWNNGGRFDERKLTNDERNLRGFYRHLLHLIKTFPVFTDGHYAAVSNNYFTRKQLAYLRYNQSEVFLIVANFDRNKTFSTEIRIPESFAQQYRQRAVDELTGQEFPIENKTVSVQVTPSNVVILKLE